MILKGRDCNPGPGPVGCRGELGIPGYYYSIQEVARLIDSCRAKGLSDTDICDYLKHIATGMDFPIRKVT